MTDGARAVEIYNSTGFKAQEWQELLLYDILAFNDDGLWVHTSFGFSLPWRNGKNEVVTIREMYGLIELGEQIMHTAHRTSTTHTAWEKWSIQKRVDLWDKEAWYQANPSLGAHLKERAIIDEIGKCTNEAKIIDELIQRFGMWFQHNQKSAISEEEWNSYICKTKPSFVGKLGIGIKYSHDGKSVSMAAAVRASDGQIFVEALGRKERRKGNDWIVV